MINLVFSSVYPGGNTADPDSEHLSNVTESFGLNEVLCLNGVFPGRNGILFLKGLFLMQFRVSVAIPFLSHEASSVELFKCIFPNPNRS